MHIQSKNQKIGLFIYRLIKAEAKIIIFLPTLSILAVYDKSARGESNFWLALRAPCALSSSRAFTD